MSAFKTRLQQMIAMREQEQPAPVAVPTGASATTTYMDVVRDLVRPLRIGEVGDLTTPQCEAVAALLSEVDRLRVYADNEHESRVKAELDCNSLDAARLAAEQRAARYDWLKAHYYGADFGHGATDHDTDDGETVLLFRVPPNETVSIDLDASIDRYIVGGSDAAAGTTGDANQVGWSGTP